MGGACLENVPTAFTRSTRMKRRQKHAMVSAVEWVPSDYPTKCTSRVDCGSSDVEEKQDISGSISMFR